MALPAKVCGLTRREDALWAAQCGATALGFIFVPHSKRRVAPAVPALLADELPPFIWRIGVFADQPLDEVRRLARAARLDAIQLHGDESSAYLQELATDWPIFGALRADRPDLLEAMQQRAPQVRSFLLDSGQGGTGAPFDWRILADLPALRPLIVAGGLDGTNLADLCRLFVPAGVDASSRLELAPGIKDPSRVAEFLAAAAKLP